MAGRFATDGIPMAMAPRRGSLGATRARRARKRSAMTSSSNGLRRVAKTPTADGSGVDEKKPPPWVSSRSPVTSPATPLAASRYWGSRVAS
jgi:hypothetical protein